jgi:hypothetical protein
MKGQQQGVAARHSVGMASSVWCGSSTGSSTPGDAACCVFLAYTHCHARVCLLLRV